MGINRVDTSREINKVTDDSQHPFDDLESTGSVSNANGSRSDDDNSRDSLFTGTRTITEEEIKTLSHFKYDDAQDQLVGDRAIETTLNSLFLGEQHKMSSGAENIFFTNLGNNTNFYPMFGGLKDQSITANQGSSGFIPPSGRVYTDMFSLPLGGNPDPLRSIGYTGGNYFGVSIAGLGITTTIAETVEIGVSLEYSLFVNDTQVYKQILPTTEKRFPNDLVEWFFDHPVEIHAGTTIFAEIRKVDRENNIDYGVLQVRMGDDGTDRYQAIVHNRLFEDKDLELISPYLKYQSMDFGLDSTGSTILLRDLSLGSDSLLVPHAVNTLEAVSNGSTIQIKIKGGAKVIVESLPVNAISIDGSFVNSVMNQAILQLNAIFTNTAGFISPDTFVNSFTLSGNDLTLGLNDGVSYTVDVTSLGVDENNFVASGSLSGSDLILTMDDASTVTVDASNLAIDENVTVTSGVVNGTDLVLTLSDSTTVTIDASTLGGSSSAGNPVVSGSVVGTDLILVLNDATQITIDASNMINGSTGLATSNGWFISYGTNANNPVGSGTTQYNNNGTFLYNEGPYYFGEDLSRGSEFRFNMTTGQQWRLGIWDGAESPIAYNQGQTTVTNWGTVFSYLNSGNRFVNSTNTDVSSYQTGTEYVVSNGAPLSLRFGNDGHLTLLDLTGGSEVIIGKTTIALNVESFKVQFGGWAGVTFPNGIISNSNFIWDVVHDFDNSENGVIDGVEDHTVIESTISIKQGEKIMFNLDEQGRNVYLGTSYVGGVSSGLSTAETELGNRFTYMTNEAINFEFSGSSDWNVNTNSTYYFNNGAGVVGYRKGSGSGTSGTGRVQGMFSLRFNSDGKLTIYSEDNNEKVATAKVDPTVGSSIKLYLGYTDTTTSYTAIPQISKQTIGGGSQPTATFVPTVADQTTSVEEGDVLNFQVISSDNIVNQFVEVDAPSWLTMSQDSGVLSGTAPSFLGTSADNIVVNCKAGNAIGGSVDFTVTISVTENTSYTNSKSLQFGGSRTQLVGNASNVTALQRASNGSGASDAWSVSMWVYPSSSSSQESIFYFGGTNPATDGAITLEQFSGGNLSLAYGKTGNTIAVFGVNTFPLNQWNHVLITYNGGTTGSNSSDLSDYYSRFGMFVNGNTAITQFQNTGNGFDGAIGSQNFRIGRYTSSTPRYFTGKINQVAIWSSDESANASTIYNSGATQDLNLLSSAPEHYYEIESSVTTVSDIIGSANLTGYNFTSSDLVTDTP